MSDKKTARFKRRELLTGSMASIARQLENKIRGMAGIAEEKRLRPPGALPRDLFLIKCDRCGACGSACPHDAIMFISRDNDENSGTPVIIPENKPCQMCGENPPCVESCPTGALIPSETGKYKIGAATISPACLIGKGVPCTYCYDFCPIKGDAIFQYSCNQQPIVREDRCNGCGVCEHYCPAHPKGIFITPA